MSLLRQGLSADPFGVEGTHPQQVNAQVGLPIAVHIAQQMSTSKPQFSRCPGEGPGADVIPAWIGEGSRTVQHSVDPQPITIQSVEVSDRVSPQARDIAGLIRKEVFSRSTNEPI